MKEETLKQKWNEFYNHAHINQFDRDRAFEWWINKLQQHHQKDIEKIEKMKAIGDSPSVRLQNETIDDVLNTLK